MRLPSMDKAQPQALWDIKITPHYYMHYNLVKMYNHF